MLGEDSRHPPLLSPDELIKRLAESPETRLQLSLIPLFLRHPQYAIYVEPIAENLIAERQLILKFFYSAAVWLERKYLSTSELPDLFSEKLGVNLAPSPDENLQALAFRQKKISASRINWQATYQHAADIWLKDLKLRKAKYGKN